MGCGTSKSASRPVTSSDDEPHWPKRNGHLEVTDLDGEEEPENLEAALQKRRSTIVPPPKGMDTQFDTEFPDSPEFDNSLTAQAIRFGYPPPKPPTTKKAGIYDTKAYDHIDKRASKVPPDMLYQSFEDLATYLLKECTTDLEKVRALFIFTASLDISKIEETLQKLPEPGTPLDYLLKIHWQMGNHAHFFAQLSRAGKIPCLVLTGVNKSAAYQIGSEIDHESMGAQWNAILVDNEWRLMDVYWASTCVIGKQSSDWALIDNDGEAIEDEVDDDEGETMHQINEFFFLPDPDKLICTHFPDEDDWQLLEEPLTIKDFEAMVYIRERYHQIGMSYLPDSHKLCLLNTQKGVCVISFGVPGDLAGKVQFRYLLFKSKQKGEQASQVPFERYVFYQKTANTILYTAQFPIKGKFKMDIFGQVEKEHESLDLVCSYLINCNDPTSGANPLPDMPEIGWGPGVETKMAGLKATTHEGAVIETKDGQVEIRFGMEEAKAFMQNLKHNELEEFLLAKHALIREENGELIINLRLPNKGDYALNLFADDIEKHGDIANVCNYLVKCLEADKNVKPFPKFHDGKIGVGHLSSELGVKALTHDTNVIKIPDGKVRVSFEANIDVELLCEIHHNDVERAVLADGVERSTSETTTNFDLDLPAAGEYAMNVYARHKDEPDRIYHVHSYKIDTEKGVDEKGVTPPKKEVPVVPLFTPEDHAEIRLPSGANPLVAEMRKKNAQDGINKDQMKSTKDGKTEMFSVKLPELGEYVVDVFEKRPGGGLVHRCTVQVVRHEPEPGEANNSLNIHQTRQQTPEEQLSEEEIERRRKERELEAKHRSYREQIKAAMSSQDANLLRQAIRDFQNNKVPQQKNELDKAKAMLDYITISQALTNAMAKRHMASLEEALAAAEKAGLQRKLNLQMQMARNILEQLKRIEKLRHEIMNLDQKTIAEIKSYANPPEAVHQVMAGCFMLLGDSQRSLREWKQVQILIGKTGKDSLKRRVSEFQVENMKIESAVRTKHIFKQFELDDVRDVSAGAATFYVWSIGMIEECESRFTQDGGDLGSIQATVGRPKTGMRKHRGSKAA